MLSQTTTHTKIHYLQGLLCKTEAEQQLSRGQAAQNLKYGSHVLRNAITFYSELQKFGFDSVYQALLFTSQKHYAKITPGGGLNLIRAMLTHALNQWESAPGEAILRDAELIALNGHGHYANFLIRLKNAFTKPQSANTRAPFGLSAECGPGFAAN